MVAETNNQFSVFTVCNIAYLPKALVLADSLMRHNGIKLKVVVFDRKQELRYPNDSVELLWVEELGVPKWLELAFMYDIIEFSTSLKPFIALKLLDSHEKVIFLDPDTCLYSPLQPILSDLESNPILLTPHYTTPQPDTAHESDLGMMRFGSFNLGFFAIKRSDEGMRFLQWWHQRCIDFCFMESQFGLSTDQKWIAIAPCLFESIKVSFNLGYNAAPWNTFERSISKNSAGAYIINNKFPLVFFHFSNFDFQDTQYLNKRASNEIGFDYPLLKEMGDEYARLLTIQLDAVDKVAYSFDYMTDGSYISPTLRRAYASVRSELPANHDPFDSTGPVGGFARKNFLIEKKAKRYVYPGLKEAREHSRLLAVIYAVLRVTLRISGPNRFYDLSKLFVYLSMYRKNRDLWKM
ncbi:MAG: hypothetical protein AB7F79_07160 [Steroidobacteraceae bacterium]